MYSSPLPNMTREQGSVVANHQNTTSAGSPLETSSNVIYTGSNVDVGVRCNPEIPPLVAPKHRRFLYSFTKDVNFGITGL